MTTCHDFRPLRRVICPVCSAPTVISRVRAGRGRAVTAGGATSDPARRVPPTVLPMILKDFPSWWRILQIMDGRGWRRVWICRATHPPTVLPRSLGSSRPAGQSRCDLWTRCVCRDARRRPRMSWLDPSRQTGHRGPGFRICELSPEKGRQGGKMPSYFPVWRDIPNDQLPMTTRAHGGRMRY